MPHRSISTELSIHLEISVLQVKKAGEELVNKRRGYSTEEDKKMKVTQLIIRTRSFSSIGRKRPKGIGDQYCNYCNLVMSHFHKNPSLGIANSFHRILTLYEHVCRHKHDIPMIEGEKKDRTEEEGISQPLPPV